MITEKDKIIQKIRKYVRRDWKLAGMPKELPVYAAVMWDNGIIQIDPRFTTHA